MLLLVQRKKYTWKNNTWSRELETGGNSSYSHASDKWDVEDKNLVQLKNGHILSYDERKRTGPGCGEGDIWRRLWNLPRLGFPEEYLRGKDEGEWEVKWRMGTRENRRDICSGSSVLRGSQGVVHSGGCTLFLVDGESPPYFRRKRVRLLQRSHSCGNGIKAKDNSLMGFQGEPLLLGRENPCSFSFPIG